MKANDLNAFICADRNVLHEHRARISRLYIRKVANLIKLERFQEAANANIRFTSILHLWQQQQNAEQERAAKDGCAEQRKAFSVK